MRTVYIGIGSNLGDRRSNILQALQRLRARARIVAVSSFYESPAAAGAHGPPFLNVAAGVETDLEPAAFERLLRDLELGLGRRSLERLAARPIDVDILLFGDATGDFGRFELPRRDLARRPFNVVPLAEIAPGLQDPHSGRSIAELAATAEAATVVRRTRGLHFDANRQEETPEVRLSIARAGVSGMKRVVRLILDGRETVFNAELAMTADLAPDKTGVHMSRFAELLEEASLEVLGTQPALRAEDLAARIAERALGSQRALSADVRLQATFSLERWTPVSAKRGEETYTLLAYAHAGPGGVRRVMGVQAEGMTACPCAQGMVREHSLAELREAGFSREDAERALDVLPAATHNQRGRGSVLLGAGEDRLREVRAEDLIEIVENSMSSETYDLLKRPDEFFIVNKAHRNPRFVEDVVRGILARTLDVYADFPDSTFVQASQINYESIHKHDAIAETFGTFGELRAELRDGAFDAPKTDLATWLGARPSAVLA